MRVIAGKHRGLRLDPPPGDHTRPITDRVKESIFNLLTHRLGTPGFLPDAHVLDLFAGCGSFGIECLSRGAASCLFVEKDGRTLRTLTANVAKLAAEPSAVVARDSVWSMRFPRAPGDDGYQVIFVDPPYRDGRNATRVAGLLDRLASRLAPAGVILLRYELGTAAPDEHLTALVRSEDRTWGRMTVEIFTRPDASQERPAAEEEERPEASR